MFIARNSKKKRDSAISNFFLQESSLKNYEARNLQKIM